MSSQNLQETLDAQKELSQQFQELLDLAFRKSMNLEGQVVKGRVVNIDKDMAIIDVNLKSEGRVAKKEFLPMEVQVGDEVEVYIDRYEGPQGEVQLSHERAKQEASWFHLTESFRNRKPIEGVITGQVKGGLTVDIMGTTAFLPGSQVDIRPARDLSGFIGTTQPFIVLKMDDSRSNVVVSRRAVLEEARVAEKNNLLATLEQGQRLQGVVKNLMDYGAFVDLGGLDGLIHITDISWKRISHPSDVLHIGQVVTVMVTRFNKETQRISLGIKQLEKDPWVNINERYKAGDKVHGVIMNVIDYGAFVEIDDGLEGLIHVGDIMWGKKNIDPKQVLRPEQEVEAMILEIDTTKRRISLGLKQCMENPIEKFAEAHPVGTNVEGEIKDVTEFGLLVGLTNGIGATVHTSDLSWNQENGDIADRYHPGQKIKMMVLDVNPAKEMIRLGVKQLMKDPWVDFAQNLKKGDVVEAHVVEIFDQGIDVALGQGVRTMIARTDLAKNKEDQNPYNFHVGDKISAKITALNMNSHHIVLSIKAQEIDEERQTVAGFSSEHGASLGSILEAAFDSKKKV